MTLKEIIQLTAAGFKAGEIREMIKLESNESKDPGQDEKKQDDSKDTGQDDKKQDNSKDPGQDKKNMEPDYKALYDKAMADLAKTKNDLSAAQIKNQSAGSRDATAEIDVERKKLQELFRR